GAVAGAAATGTGTGAGGGADTGAGVSCGALLAGAGTLFFATAVFSGSGAFGFLITSITKAGTFALVNRISSAEVKLKFVFAAARIWPTITAVGTLFVTSSMMLSFVRT